MARPTSMTEDTISKLRQAFLVGATVEEAAYFAEISPSTIYNHNEKHPGFLDQIEAWKSTPILKAKTTIVKSLDETKSAQWYLERKAKKEYGANVDVTTDGKALPVPIIKLED